MKTAICVQCGSEFPVKPYLIESAKYCSRDCAGLARRGKSFKPPAQVTLNCVVCQKAFSVPQSAAERRTCCSKRCYWEYRRGKSFINSVRNCERCGVEYRTSSATSRFCSQKCREQEVEKTCEQCGKTYAAKRSHDALRRFCSRECFALARTTDHTRKCKECGSEFEAAGSKRKYCSITCSTIANRRAKPQVPARLNQDGYKVLWTKGKPTLEHRHVAEQMIGRELLPHETVHHKNGDRGDNRPENLEVWIKRPHAGQRPEDLIPWMIQVLTAYGYTVTKHEPTLTSPDQLGVAGGSNGSAPEGY